MSSWTLWAVPAVLVLLPGLAIVRAKLAPTVTLQVAGLADALLTAFAIGVGVASGDILVSTYWQVREHVLDPVVGAVASGIDTLVTRSSEGSRAEPSQPDASRDERP
jgi:uncharacterized membrane protein YjjB (DUF3815 family)